LELAVASYMLTNPNRELRFREIALSQVENSFYGLDLIDRQLAAVKGKKQTDSEKTDTFVSIVEWMVASDSVSVRRS